MAAAWRGRGDGSLMWRGIIISKRSAARMARHHNGNAAAYNDIA